MGTQEFNSGQMIYGSEVCTLINQFYTTCSQAGMTTQLCWLKSTDGKWDEFLNLNLPVAQGYGQIKSQGQKKKKLNTCINKKSWAKSLNSLSK